MKWFYDLKIAKKLILSFTCVLALTAISGIFSIVKLQKVNAASSDISTNWLPTVRTLADIKLLLSRVRSNEAQIGLYSDDKETVATITKRTEGFVADLNKAFQTYEGQISEPAEKAIYGEMKAKSAAFLTEHNKLMSAAQSQPVDVTKKLLAGDASKTYYALLADLDKLIKINTDGSNASSASAEETYASARILIISMLAGALAIGFTLAVFVARVIASPLTIAVGVAKQVAGGDLTAQIRPATNDETGELMHALKAMNDSLLNIVGQVRTGTDTIGTASSEIASGNLDLSSRTEEQASSLEETASAMEQLTSTVKQNSENARQANQLAVSASHIAVEGGNVVGQVVETMSSINESSKKIVDIISVIDGIAFQTNILALNAAVEAARAGEQGRGFAVVASEVRSLAQRSAAAAKEIKVLIATSVSKVDEGSRLVNNAGTTMAEVVASIHRVSEVVAEISTASSEQSVGIDEINRAMTQMDEVTQQNAALVEEAAAAAQSLQEQAKILTSVVSVFKLSESSQSSHKTRPAAGSAKPATGKFTARPASPKPAAKLAVAAPAAKPAPAIASNNSDDWETF
jgi:methyl-accepting chemotaxis protein